MSEANGRATTHCSNCNPGEYVQILSNFGNTNHIGSESASSEPCELADIIDGDTDHGNTNAFDTSPGDIAYPHRPLQRCAGVITTPDLDTQSYSPALPQFNLGIQSQTASNAHSESNYDVSIPPSLWNPAVQCFPGWLSPAIPEFNPCLTPTSNSIGYPPVDLSATTHDQADLALQLPGVYNDFSAYGQPGSVLSLPGHGVYNNLGIMHGNFANFNSFPCRHHFTAGDPQATVVSSYHLPFLSENDIFATPAFPGQQIGMLPTPPAPQTTIASSNQLPFLGTDDIMAAPALPGQQIGMLSTPSSPRPMASRMMAPGSNANTNRYTCDHPGCGQRVARRGDLVRHRLKHGVPQYPCLVVGCGRRGPKAFYRIDKLRAHQLKRHGMAN
ncbi:hypothetical protein BP5796_09868 [Coleophoma crateriformis]|uniref:C2H2-type domain-containing protein n=1 Tax=Coleophoma crateriformis TaxID=565419 RepID=A0A3D8QTL6_9HELO|nr:hypothetical protein BP5796_09868 [Coleophoma crateriformis]